MDLNDKSLASLQPKVSPWRYILESQANEINFDLKTVQPNSISKTHIAIRFNLLHFWPSGTFFCICCVVEIFFHYFICGYFKISPNFMAISHV